MLETLAPILLSPGTHTCDKLGVALLSPVLARDPTGLTLTIGEGESRPALAQLYPKDMRGLSLACTEEGRR